jgi:glutaredoxin
VTIVVYGKPDCSLCEKANAILQHLRREFDFNIEHIDITADPRLFRRYREKIPVLTVDGREIAWGNVTVPTLRSAVKRLLEK